jgi:hypothetical protein
MTPEERFDHVNSIYNDIALNKKSKAVILSEKIAEKMTHETIMGFVKFNLIHGDIDVINGRHYVDFNLLKDYIDDELSSGLYGDFKSNDTTNCYEALLTSITSIVKNLVSKKLAKSSVFINIDGEV